MSEPVVKTPSVVLVNAHPIECAGFKSMARDMGIEGVVAVSGGSSLVDAWDGSSANVLVICLRDKSSAHPLDLLTRLREERPQANVVCVGPVERRGVVFKAYEAGSCAYVPETADACTLMGAVIEAARGQKTYPKEVAELLAEFGAKSDPRKVLNDREFETFLLMAEGKTIVEIAELKRQSLKTISNTSTSIKKKLDTNRPAKLALMAVRWGYIDL